MKGVILAAGRGLRLNGTTGNTPKCLLELGELTLLERQIRSLRACGITDIIVVVGYESERVRKSCDAQIRFIENSRFDETNSLYSLWLARDLLLDGFVVINSDVLFHPQLLFDLLTSKFEDGLVLACRDQLPTALGEEEMKVQIRDGRVVNISKTMDPKDADGENVGIVKFGPSGAKLLIEKMESLITAGCHRDWAPRAFFEFAAKRNLYITDTRGYPWIEIDFPEDYQKAVNDVLPKIPLPAEHFGARLAFTVETGLNSKTFSQGSFING